MRTPLPDRFTDLLARAEEVGEQIAEWAVDVDARRAPPDKVYRILADAGFLALLVPRGAGGAGLGFEQYWRVLAVLGRHNTAAALGLNMHNAVIGAICESADMPLPPFADDFRTWLFAQVVEEHRMFASAASEAAGGAKLTRIATTYHREPGSDTFTIDGEKSAVSLAGVADYYAVPARPDDSDDPGRVTHFLVARDDPGVTFGELRDMTALNGTSTATMSLRAVPVPRSRLFLGLEGMSLPKMVREPHWMIAGYAGAYLGLLDAIHRSAADRLAASPERAAAPGATRELGLMSMRLTAARAVAFEAARGVGAHRGTIETNALVHAAKYVVGEVGAELARSALRVCGTAAVSRPGTLERLLREVQYIDLMPAKPDECLEYLGKAALGVDLLDERALTW